MLNTLFTSVPPFLAGSTHSAAAASHPTVAPVRSAENKGDFNSIAAPGRAFSFHPASPSPRYSFRSPRPELFVHPFVSEDRMTQETLENP